MVQVSVQICQKERTIYVTYADAMYQTVKIPDCQLEALWGSMYRYVLSQMANGQKDEIDLYYGRDNEHVVFKRINTPNVQEKASICF